MTTLAGCVPSSWTSIGREGLNDSLSGANQGLLSRPSGLVSVIFRLTAEDFIPTRPTDFQEKKEADDESPEIFHWIDIDIAHWLLGIDRVTIVCDSGNHCLRAIYEQYSAGFSHLSPLYLSF